LGGALPSWLEERSVDQQDRGGEEEKHCEYAREIHGSIGTQ
jgi:hypothetical protein